MAVTHVAFDFRARNEGGDGVDDDDVEGAGADEHVHDFQGLLAGVRLGDQERVGVDAELGGVFGIEGVLGVDEGGDAAVALRVGDGVRARPWSYRRIPDRRFPRCGRGAGRQFPGRRPVRWSRSE